MKIPPYNEKVILSANLLPMRAFISSNATRVMDVHPHWHNEIELLLYVRGQARQQIGAQHFLAEESCLVVIGGGVVHGTQADGIANCDIWVVQANLQQLYSDCPIPGILAFLESFHGQSFVIRSLDTASEAWHAIVALFEVVYEAMNDQVIDTMLLFRSYAALGSLLVKLKDVGCFQGVLHSRDTLPIRYDVLENVFHLIDTDSGDITTEQAARAANMSVSHFCRLFKAYTGISFGNYLNRYRIRQAQQMLIAAGNLTNIAFACGFGSVSAFVRCFVRIHGMTPSAWRKILWSK